MAENMYSPGQKVPTDKFRDNFEKTFGSKKGHCNGSGGENCKCGHGKNKGKGKGKSK
jgi:hypothetical protein